MGANILIITSNQENLLLFEAILSREGFNVLKAENSTIGLRIAINKNPDLIVMDGREFEGDGYEVLNRIKNQQIATRVIICPVAQDSLARVKKFVRVGICNYITLPVETKTLVDTVKKTLAQDDNTLAAL